MLGYIESFIIIASIYFIIYQIYLKKKEKKYIIKFSAMYIYLFFVLCVTILGWQQWRTSSASSACYRGTDYGGTIKSGFVR